MPFLFTIPLFAFLKFEYNAGDEPGGGEHDDHDNTLELQNDQTAVVQQHLDRLVAVAHNDLQNGKVTEDGGQGYQGGDQNTGQHAGHDACA